MRLEFSPAAESDLVEIARFIAEDNGPRALSFVDELEGACAVLVDHPLAGTPRTEIRAGLRSKPHGRYVIFYTPLKATIRIERILHGSRDIGVALSN